MSITIVAPCGLICDLCSAFQREKNHCPGCTAEGNKPKYCTSCVIVNCPEKHGDSAKLCSVCSKYPCKRLKSLNKRYKDNYDESLFENFHKIEQLGLDGFIAEVQITWKCPGCGELFSVHHPQCTRCKTPNSHYLRKPKSKT